jgi:cytochrome P450
MNLQQTMTLRTPPGPAAPLTLDEIRGDPLQFLVRMRERYGDIVQYGTTYWRAVLLAKPDYIQHVLQDNFRNYQKVGTPDLRMLKPMLGDGLLTSDGETWRAQRHVLGPIFRRQQIESFGPLITRLTAASLDGWVRPAAEASPIELTGEMSRLTLCVVAQALFSHEVGADAGTFGAAVEVLNESMGSVRPQDPEVTRRFLAALAVIHDIVDRALAERRESPQAATDALALMLNARDADGRPVMSDSNLRDQSVTLLLAGHETTAKALAWTFHVIGRYADVADRLFAEIDAVLAGRMPTVQDLPRLPYIWAVLQETMRLFTPIWVVSRIAIKDDAVDGFRIPAGSLIPISPYLVHRHPDYWETPELFDPERFLEPNATQRHPFQFIPFGAGPRHCIGQHFASMEMQLVLIAVLQRYRLIPREQGPVEPEALVTLRPRGGLWMVPQRRADAK